MFNWENNVTPLNDTNLNQAQRDLKSEILLACYPVGSYYWSSESTDPSTLFGGTWERVKDKFVYALGDTGSAGDTGGSETHTLTEAELPSLSGSINMHSAASATNVASASGKFSSGLTNQGKYRGGGDEVSGSGVSSVGVIKWGIGSGQSHNNMPPYIKAYCFRRTA